MKKQEEKSHKTDTIPALVGHPIEDEIGIKELLTIMITVSPLHTNLQVTDFQRCKRVFSCPIM